MVEKPFTKYVPESIQKKWDEEDSKTMSCPKCGGKFFIALEARRYTTTLPPTNIGPLGIPIQQVNPSISLGQQLPTITGVAFPVYMCVTKDCHTIVTPTVDGGEEMGPRAWALYNELCDSIEGKKKE